eukprot:TRINITY_DN47307_c0_g1_i1.p1 TRINITY_DN47307_c0_g1~~TRINITY_DN47307_c0_g1_i1.p1  ORF type:complete len:1336 (-),score=247.97 TRINITY_DN47307_c0_g1_i1:137-4120(-)
MFPVSSLAYAGWRKGSLGEEDCEALPRLCAPAGSVIETGRQFWLEEKQRRGSKASLKRVVFRVIRAPLSLTFVLLSLRGFGNAFALPMLLNLIIESAMRKELESAAMYLGFLLLERVIGAIVEFQGFQLATTKIPTDAVMAVAALAVDKAAAPGLTGLQKAGVDPSSLVGRELNMLHMKSQQMLPNGFIALPTLLSGFVTLFLLLGWSAIFGVAWTIFTIFAGFQVQERAKVAEGQMATVASARLGVLDNIVTAIKAIKYFAWESEFLAQLTEKRVAECDRLKIRARWTALAIGIGKLTPVTGSLATFVAYALLGHEVKPGIIFAANSVFMTLRFSVGATSFFMELWKTVSLTFGRAEKLLALPERPARQFYPDGKTALAEISSLDVSFADGQSKTGKASDPPAAVNSAGGEAFRLVVKNMQLGAKGKLTAICGTVGSGKSVLLNTLLGHVAGDATLNGSSCAVANVGWCPQKAFVISGTIEENILLGRPFDEARLNDCLADACLGTDLEQMEAGLQEVIGERGTTLSGGQQARVSLARALYGNPSLLLLDDPFAAVDAAVGRALLQALRLRCRGPVDDVGAQRSSDQPGAIVVLNQLPLLPNFDEIVFLKDGNVRGMGSFTDLQSNQEFIDFMHEVELQKRGLDEEQDVNFAAEERGRVHRVSLTSIFSLASRPKSLQTDRTRTSIIQKETTASGFVRWAVWRSYIFAPGRAFFFGLMLVYCIMYGTLGTRDWWMSVWADADGGDQSMYITLFVVFGLSHVAVVILACVLIGSFAKAAGQNLHADCVHHLLHAPMSYFDRTPSGRITSRLGPDLAMVDSALPSMIDVLFTFSFMVIMMCATVISRIPIMAAVFAAAFVSSYPAFLGIATLRQDAKRHSNNAMAPILSNLSDIRNGAVLANSLGCLEFFLERHRGNTEKWSLLTNGSSITGPMAQAWCHFMHFFVLSATGALTWYQLDSLLDSPGLIAMYFSYASLWGLFAMVTMGATMGLLTNGASLERLVEYKLGDLPQEAPWSMPSDPSTQMWPSKGAISFKEVSLRYQPGLPLVLDGFSLDIAGGEKIGIVGRTGAGKSSITSVLFRLVECEAGCITIDGLDIAQLGLHTLRKAISMIPQEPIVMNGSIRYNLDPFGRDSDERLLEALQTCGLPGVSLDAAASGAGASLSAGQKQLLTLGRTLLQDTRIVMMDEPTASVDMQTDRYVQRMSREAFATRTVLTIAHRLDTVRKSNRLIVMDKGQLVEAGPPEELLADPSSRLSVLVAAESGQAGTTSTGERPASSKKNMRGSVGLVDFSGMEDVDMKRKANEVRKNSTWTSCARALLCLPSAAV